MKKILIIEDEQAISHVLKAYLNKLYTVTQVFDGAEALPAFNKLQPDLVLLDVMLPHKNGWAILQEIRAISTCPVIMLTALEDVHYKLKGFQDGADDYIAKPFIGEEVLARVNAVLRRSPQQQSSIITFGHLSLDATAHIIKLNNQEVFLAPRDLSVLLFLAEHPNRTFTREQLIEQIWGWDYDGSDRAVDLAIKRIRKALADWPIEQGEIRTLRGLGYQLHVE